MNAQSVNVVSQSVDHNSLPESKVNTGNTDNSDFMKVISNFISNNNQLSDTNASTTKFDSDSNQKYSDNLTALLLQYCSSLINSGLSQNAVGDLPLSQTATNSSNTAITDLSAINLGSLNLNDYSQTLNQSENNLIFSELSASGILNFQNSNISPLISDDSNQILSELNKFSDSQLTSFLSYLESKANTDLSTNASTIENPTDSSIQLEALLKLINSNSDNSSSSDFKSPFLNNQTAEKLSLLKDAISKGEVKVSKNSDESSQIAKLNGNYEFTKSVATAKKAVDENKSDSILQQNQIFDYGKLNSSDVNLSKNFNLLSDNQAVTSQTLDSLQKAIDNQIEKFTVKFNPNGLGEITVNLEKTENGLIVNMVADNAKTAEILNKQLNTMQSDLSDYNAKFNPATITAIPQSNSFSFNQNQFDQHFSQQDSNREHFSYQNIVSNDLPIDDNDTATYGILNTYA